MSIDIKHYSQLYIKNLKSLLDELDLSSIDNAADIFWRAYQEKRKIFVVGNGGSASTASHMACDFNKTVKGHKGDAPWPGFRVISLTDNIPLITSWSNDVNYTDAYAEQLRNLADKDDVLVAISSSGDSVNILNCVKVARLAGLKVIAIAGFGGGKLAGQADVSLVTNFNEYGPVEDIQLILVHLLTCYFYEKLSQLNKSQ